MPFHGVLVAMPDSIGNTLSTAQSIIIGTTTKRFSDSVEFGDQDYFRFNLSSASSLRLTLSGLSANADVEVLDSSGNAITVDSATLRSTNEGTLVESINTSPLAAGIYYIRVFPGPPADASNAAGTTPTTNYNLDVQTINGISNDIVWRNLNTGSNTIWRMNGTSSVSSTPINSNTAPSWRIVGATDFNGDGTTDILWRNVSTGVNAFWLLNGNTIGGFVTLNPETDLGWQIRGLGNFDGGAGGADVLWHKPSTGELRVWYLNATGNTTAVTALRTSTGALANLRNARIEALGDFNGDNQTDIVWRSGQLNNVWLMNRTTITSVVPLAGETNTNKAMQGAGDFNGDGSADLLWRNFSTGDNEIWLMEGTSRTSIVPLPRVSDLKWTALTPYTRSQPLTLFDIGGPQLTSAFEIGVLNGNGTYQEAVGTGTDLNDYYRFSLGSPTQLNLSLDGFGTNALQGNLDVQILSQTGSVISTSNNPGTAGETISDLNLGAGTYFIRVFPGEAGAASTYDLNLTVNNLPVLVSSGPLTVNEGALQTISNNLLLVTDENDPPARVVYTLVTPPTLATGSLLSNGQALIANSTFTQADINAGRITYRNNGEETTQDSFVFAVADGRGGVVADTTFAINVTPVNDPPVLQSLNPIAATEGLLTTLDNTILLVTDIEQGPSQVVYSITSLPTAGNLSLLAGGLIGPLTLGATFTQADINANRIGYRQNGSETTTDQFTFVATDGSGGFLNPQTQTLGINIQPVNDPPVLVTNIPLTVSQAGPGFITSALLRATDPELLTPALQDRIVFSVTSLPTAGKLFLNAVEQTAPFTFTQADLNAAIPALSYAQGGTPSNSDRFTFVVTDGSLTIPATGEFTYDIFVQRVAGPPVLATPNPRASVDEGDSVLINTAILQVTDPDSAPFLITYTLGATPTSGSLLRLGTALTAGQTFTQLDLDSDRIRYQHNGNEQPAVDTFTFTFKDESGAGPTTVQTLSITVNPINDAPTLLTTNPQITVTEGTDIFLSQTLLNATDPDNLPQDITYTVTTPTNGTILRSGTSTNEFTQADINGGQIKYLQNGTESTSDSFSFTIKDSLGLEGGGGIVNINVIPFNDAPGIAVINPLPVNEGETAAIGGGLLSVTDNDGPGPITYTITDLPANGVLRRGNLTLSTGGTFTQADLDGGQLFYVNNGSESTSDRFTFTASDGATTGLGAPGLIPTTTFTINVTPTNDPPAISLNTGLTISEGNNANLNSVLRATDPDNLNITYTNINGPLNGTILSAGTAVTTFTQAELAGNLISYRHNGSETTLDAFTFELTDGENTTATQTFNIAVTPVNDNPVSVTIGGVTVDEAGTANISDGVLLVTDPDGPSESVIYTLSAIPTRGVLVRGTTTLTSGDTFTQAEVTGNQLSYIDNGRDPVTNDRFTFTASDGATGTLGLQTFSLTVNPINDAPLITAPTTTSALEDTTFTFSGANVLSVADIDGGPAYEVRLTAQSGGTINLGSTAFPGITGNGTNDVIFTTTLANVNNALRNLRYRGVQDFNGEELIVISLNDGNPGGVVERTVTLNVAAVNDGPTLSASATTLNLLEDQAADPFNFQVTDVDAADSPLSVVLRATNGGITVSDPGTLTFDPAGANGSSVVIFTGTLDAVNNALASVGYQPTSNYSGSDRITVSVNDQGATGLPGSTPSTVSRTINVNVTSVNDAPTFTVTGNSVINVNEDSGQQIVPFASGISTGAANENQSLSFSIAPGPATDAALLTGLFTTTPTINPTTGNLTFSPRANANGTVTLSAFLVDNGGTLNGGQNTSAPFEFVIEVNQVNDAPTFSRGTVPNITEDAGPITINNWATNILVGPTTAQANESGQTPTFIFETSNPSLFASGPQIVNLSGNSAALTFTPADDANGIATVTVRLQDDGGTANGGIDTSATQTFTINVLSRNDAPTLNQLQTEITVLEDDPQQSVQIADTIRVGPDNELTQTATFTIINNSNPTLFSGTGGITPQISPDGFLTFKTATNAFGNAVIVARLVDNGGTANGGANQSTPFTFTVNATPVNDAPSFSRGSNLTINEDAPAQSIANWATNITPGPNETGQLFNFNVETDNPTLFAAGPAIDNTGRLTYTPAANAFGTAIVTVSLTDNGDIANGGVDTSTVQTFTITVNPINDSPTLTVPTGPLATNEDEAITFTGPTAIDLTDIDSGSNPVEVRVSARNGTVLLPSTTGLSISNGSNGSSSVTFTGTIADFRAAFATLVYTPNANFNGSDGVTVVVNDRGAFGGGTAPTVVTRSIPINIAAVNDGPVLLTLGQAVVAEGGNGPISNTLLRTTDVDNTAGQIVYTLLDAPDSGTLRLSSGLGFTPIALNGTFTQADIDAGRLNYLHNGAETTSDNFVFGVSDGAIALPDSTFNITVLPVNDPPRVVRNLGASVPEGNVVVIESTLLEYVDDDNTAAEVIYTLTSAPSTGTLRVGGSDLTVGSTFTQEQLNIGLVSYEQNGAESTNDIFNFQVSDGISTLQSSFNITIEPVNDPPRFVTQGALTVSEGASSPLTTRLITTDPDTPTTELRYTLTGGPGFGNLLLNGTTTIGVGQTFTQAQVNSGAISYRNNGSEIATDAFFFTVSDGTTTDSGILNINVNPVNDPPVLVRNTGLTLSASTPTTRVLNESQLFGTDVDNTDPKEVVYRVLTLPNSSIGTLRLNGTPMAVGQTFSQEDVRLQKVSYQYLGGGTSDGFQFVLQDINGTTSSTGSQFFRISFTA